MSKRSHGNKEMKKPKQVPPVVANPSVTPVAPVPMGGKKPQQAKK